MGLEPAEPRQTLLWDPRRGRGRTEPVEGGVCAPWCSQAHKPHLESRLPRLKGARKSPRDLVNTQILLQRAGPGTLHPRPSRERRLLEQRGSRQDSSLLSGLLPPADGPALATARNCRSRGLKMTRSAVGGQGSGAGSPAAVALVTLHVCGRAGSSGRRDHPPPLLPASEAPTFLGLWSLPGASCQPWSPCLLAARCLRHRLLREVCERVRQARASPRPPCSTTAAQSRVPSTWTSSGTSLGDRLCSAYHGDV